MVVVGVGVVGGVVGGAWGKHFWCAEQTHAVEVDRQIAAQRLTAVMLGGCGVGCNFY